MRSTNNLRGNMEGLAPSKTNSPSCKEYILQRRRGIKGGEVTIYLPANLSFVFDDVVSQRAYRLYLYLYLIAGIHGADAAGGAGGNNIPRH